MVNLTKEQILLLQLSDKDIQTKNLITQKQLDANYSKCLKESRFTDEQKAELDRRLNDYKRDIGNTYTWEETIIETEQRLKRHRDQNKL